MERVILIKYGELTTKKGNRNFFVKTLYNNMKQKLSNYQVTITKDISRMYLTFDESELDSVLDVINHIFGIHTYHVAYKIKTDLEEIQKTVVDILKKESFRTFKVETKRSDKTFSIPSMEMNRLLGGVVLKQFDSSVDVHHPDLLLHVEIRPFYTYIYTNCYYGIGGYPVGTQSKGMLMLSGGIDSPVAFYLALKRGIKVEAVYFEAIPHTSIEARNKVISLCRKLSKYTSRVKLHIVPFTEIQEAIYKNCDPDYTITIMRRMMYRIMEEMCKKNKALAIINGESIGQVASQTLTSMNVINHVTSYPVIRPVCCLDKLEIIDIAKRIDTYDISILPYEDCCTVFVPKHPVINPTIDVCILNESRFDYLNLIQKTISKIEVLTIEEKEDSLYQSYL